MKPSRLPPRPRELTAVDLFCGAGGLSLGLHAAGFKTLLAVDSNRAAVATYQQNVDGNMTAAAIDENFALPEVTLIAGGPPCQGFSSAGLRRPGDSRNTLVSVFAGLIAKYRPFAFLFENVEGFLTAEDGARVFDLLDPLIAAGYHIHLRKVNAANFGVPQHRKRVIAIGGLGWSPAFPEPTHTAYGAPGALRVARHLPQSPTLAEALSGLPPAADRAPGDPPGHFFTPLKPIDLERVQALAPGQTMRDLPIELWHESFKRRAFRRVQDGTPTERRGGAPSGLKRLRPDEPSKAITSGARTEFIHPLEHRNLTLRECARIQTFADNFEFVGTQAEQALLIGNAVPPQLATALARHLASEIRTARPPTITPQSGRLLSFRPTAADGMSPVLARVTRTVEEKFKSSQVVDPGERARRSKIAERSTSGTQPENM